MRESRRWPLFTDNALKWSPGSVKCVSVDALPPELASPRFYRGRIFQARSLGNVFLSFAFQPAGKPLRHVAQLADRFCEVKLVSRLGGKWGDEENYQ